MREVGNEQQGIRIQLGRNLGTIGYSVPEERVQIRHQLKRNKNNKKYKSIQIGKKQFPRSIAILNYREYVKMEQIINFQKQHSKRNCVAL